MDSPGKLQLLITVQHICVQHGFDREDFLCLMETVYGKRMNSPEEASQHDLRQVVIASLRWACPPHTPVMDARREAAKRSWLGAASFEAAA